jgi:hypothetical protein
MWITEYRSYLNSTTGSMILEKRDYPDLDNNASTAPTNTPAWNAGWSVDDSNFNGVVYVDGASIPILRGPARTNSSTPDSAPPAVASFAKINIVSSSSISIQNDLKYERPLCYDSGSSKGYATRDAVTGAVTKAFCDDPDDTTNPPADNVLGIYTAGNAADITILNGLQLTDFTIHGVMMSAQGRIQVEGAASTCPTQLNPGTGRGNLRLLGGIIQNYYGAWGQFSNTGALTCGYGRSVTYDKRMIDPAVRPPGFPTANQATNWQLNVFRDDNPSVLVNQNNPVNQPFTLNKGATQSSSSR